MGVGDINAIPRPESTAVKRTGTGVARTERGANLLSCHMSDGERGYVISEHTRPPLVLDFALGYAMMAALLALTAWWLRRTGQDTRPADTPEG